MAVDTYTSANRLTLQGTGNNASTWGQVLNTIIQLIEDAGGGVVSVDVTSGDVTLTTNNGATDQSRQKTLQVTGSPSVQRNVIIPNQKKYYLVDNQTSAACTVVVKNVSGTGVTIAPNAKAIVYCDKTSTRAIYNSTTGVLAINAGGTSASTATSARTKLGLGNFAVVSVSTKANSLLGTDVSANVVNVSVRNPIRVSAGVAQIDAATSASSGVIRIATSNEASVGTSRTVALAPYGVAKMFHSTATSNGYVDLPGGITFQWGAYRGGANSPTISFAKAFSSPPWNITGQMNDNAGDMVMVFNTSVGGFTGDQFSISGAARLNAFYWLAIGPT